MLGWNISIYPLRADAGQLLDGAVDPEQLEEIRGERLAVWQTGIRGLDWLDALITDDRAVSLQRNGYPSLFLVRASGVIELLTSGGPPDAKQLWQHDAGDVLTRDWVGQTRVNESAVAALDPGAWLLVTAWDES